MSEIERVEGALQIEKWVVRMVYLRIKSDRCG